LFSSQEIHIEIRAVDGYMTSNAFAAGLKAKPAMGRGSLRVDSRMTLQAQLSAFATNQQHAVCGSVWAVADHAGFHSRSWMLVNKRPALLNMTTGTGFRHSLVEICLIGGAMGIVAVRAFHQAFRHAVMRGKGELGLNGPMARIAKGGLGSLEQALVKPAGFVRKLRNLKEMRLGSREGALALVLNLFNEVRGMAAVAGDAFGGVLRMVEHGLLFAADVTRETAFRVFLCRAMKAEDQFIRGRSLCIIAVCRFFGVGMRLARSVAGFARHYSFLF
jgi:hypothetical protein